MIPLAAQRRFFAQVNKNGGIPSHVPGLGQCWEWTGYDGRSGGYGDMSINKKWMRVHRVSWMIHYGDIPKGMMVLHKCDFKKCVRFDHLFLGTDSDNAKDRAQKKRSADTHGAKNPFSKLTPEQVVDILETSKALPVRVLAKRYNVTYQQVWKIRAGRAWTHLLKPTQTT